MKKSSLKMEMLLGSRDEIVEKYLEGYSIFSLAESLGVPNSTLHDFMERLGVPLRNRAQARAASALMHPNDQIVYEPTPEEIEKEKVSLRQRHREKRMKEKGKYPKAGLPLGRTAINMVSTKDLGR